VPLVPSARPHLKRFDYADTLHQQVRALRLPACEREYRFDPVRKWRFDLCWPARKLAVECDGGQWKPGGGRHGTGKDFEKMNAAQLAGWRVLHFTGTQIRQGYAIGVLEKELAS